MEHETCQSCGYALAIHRIATAGWPTTPDRNGGCPADEVDAMRRWGLL